MATEFFMVYGISERNKLIFKKGEIKNTKIIITLVHKIVEILQK